MRESLEALIHITILGLCAWIFNVELQTMLLFSIAFNLAILKIKTEDDK